MSKLDVTKKTLLKTQSHERNYKNAVRNLELEEVVKNVIYDLMTDLGLIIFNLSDNLTNAQYNYFCIVNLYNYYRYEITPC